MRNIREFGKKLSIIALSMLMLVTNVNAKGKNVDLRISPINDTVLSGNTANFIVEVKTTGSKAELTDIDLEIDIPEDYILSSKAADMKIFNEEPVYENGKLTYHFDKLNTGKTQRAIIKLESTNGIHANGDLIKLSGEIKTDGTVIAKDNCKVLVEATGNIDVAKRMKEVVGKSKTEAPNAGDTIIWELRTSMKKRDLGQMYINEGSKVKVVDTLPKELIYVSDNANGTYDENTHAITWEFDAPSIEEQKAMQGQLFLEDIEIETRVIDADSETYHMEIWNKLEAFAELVDGKVVTNETYAKAIAADGTGGTPVIHGTYYHGNHYGPADGQGGQSQPANANPNPAVYDNAVLDFGAQYYIHPGSGVTVYVNEAHYGYNDLGQYNYEAIVKNGYDWMKFVYNVDEKLLLNTLSLGIPYNNYISTSEVTHLANLPKGKLTFIMNNGETIVHEFEYFEIEDRIMNVDLDELLGENRDVKNITLDILPNENYGFIDGRIGLPSLMNMTYTIKEGAVGLVSNTMDTSFYANGLGLVHYEYYADWANNGVRNAQIVPKPEGTLPIGSTKIDLETNYAGVVMPGENTLKVEFENVKGSLDNIEGPYDLFLKLPNNIEFTDDIKANFDIDNVELIHSNGANIYKVSVSGDKLRPGDKVTLDIPVNLKDEGSATLDMSVYAQAGSTMLAPEYSGNAITNTEVVSEDDQLIVEGLLNGENTYLKSNNSYTLLKNEELVIEKQVKGALDEEWSDFGHTIPGGYVDYKIEMWHTIDASIDSMVLMDVFPNVGDLGITDNIERDSVFGVDLDGPIELNEELRDLFEVYYSKSKNPKRDALSANTSRPLTNPEGAEEPNWTLESDVEDWSEINSFMIKLKGSMEWPEKEKLTITFRMVAEEYIDTELISISKEDPFKKDKAAWNSAAVAIEDLQVIEPSRVGVAVIDKLEIQEPTIDKTVENNKEHLANLNDEFTYSIDVELPESVNAYESLVITDEIDERLEVQKVLVNGEEVHDVLNDNVLSVSFDREEIVIMHRDGNKELKVEIVAKVKEVTLDKNNNPEVIENTAKVDVNGKVIIEVEEPTIVTPEIPMGEITAAVIVGENKIHEVDEINGDRLIGSTVTITSHDDNPYIVEEVITTNDENEIVKLPAGKYVVRQETVVDGYIKTVEAIIVEVVNGELTVVEVWNPKKLTPAKITAVKTSDVKEITAGEVVEYVITVTNEGEQSKVVNVKDTFADMIDAVEFIDEVVVGDETYTFEELMNGIDIEVKGESKVDFVFAVRFSKDADGEYVNVANVDELTPETPVTVTPLVPEIIASKVVDKDEVKAGENVTYTIEVKNIGNAEKNVVIQDTFEDMIDNIEFISKIIEIKGKEYSIDELINGIEVEVQPSETIEISVEVKFNQDAAGEFTNTADIDGHTPSVPVNVIPDNPVIKAEKLVNKNEVLAGETVEYTIKVWNEGNAEKTFTIQDNLENLIDDITADEVRIGDDVYTIEELIEGIEVTLGAGDEIEVVFEVTFGIKAEGEYINVANVDGNKPSIPVNVIPNNPIIKADKTANVSEIEAGETVEYTITVWNEGNASKIVTIKDDMANLIDHITFVEEYVMVDGVPYTFSELRNGIKVEIDAGETVEVKFTVQFNEDAEGDFVNVANVDELTPETTITVTPLVPEETPEVPEETPEVPEETPEEPEETPEVPEETPEEPEETPEVPEETPEEPEETPEVPEETPEEPEETPEVPEETPEEPEETPEVPEETPETPEETPEVPEETPETPEETPEVPEETPETPEETPEVPEETPETPEETPEVPEETPETPEETPEVPEEEEVKTPEIPEIEEVENVNKQPNGNAIDSQTDEPVQTSDRQGFMLVSFIGLGIAIAYLFKKED